MGFSGATIAISTGSLFAILIPVGLFLSAFTLLIKETQRKSRRPFTGNPLRPPGESLRLKVEGLGERILFRLMGLAILLFPTAMICDDALKRGDTAFAVAIGAVGTALSLGLLLWVWQSIKEWRNYALGFDGERAVGEELNRLMLDGCQVFHDLAIAKRGNIDHIVVAPHQVFAVETKALRKRIAKRADQEEHKVTFTGSELLFPNRRNTKFIKQARSNAEALSEKLSRLTAEPVKVTPVLVICGWFIERTGKGDVKVVNDDQRKELRPTIVDYKAKPMDPKQWGRIVQLLEEWSRESMGWK